ncbi:MAG TPA: arsenate reductase (glutaredoxin) [Brumimicrobium sp.]|nr:arsenate reductase (glutaredoxin) [Brumimicrobium sp.]
MKIYHNPRCSKSRSALQLLEDKGLEVEIVKYLEDTPSKSELKDLLKKLGLKAEEIVRKGENDYKENFKGKILSEDEWIAAFIRYPKLIERPIFVKGDKAVVGRPPENVLSLL